MSATLSSHVAITRLHSLSSSHSFRSHGPTKSTFQHSNSTTSPPACAQPSFNPARRFRHSCAAAAVMGGPAGEAAAEMEIQVCAGKSCRKDGALQTLDHFRGLAPPHVNVDSCGCLGRCGAGPNLVLLPSETVISHCSTVAHVARLLERQCGGGSAETNLAALELKGRGNAAFEKGRADEAERLFSQAIALSPVGGMHNLLCNRAAARVACGNPMGALEDADAAAVLKPGWSSAVIRRAEALAALGRGREALEAYHRLADTDAEFRRSKQYLRKVKELERATEAAA